MPRIIIKFELLAVSFITSLRSRLSLWGGGENKHLGTKTECHDEEL
jgi:hypothetical protein